MNNFLRKYRTRYTTYNKLLEIESEDRVYLEKEIRNMNSFEGLFHPGISFIGSFIHSFIFFFFSLFPNNGVLSRNRVKPRSIYPRSIHHGYCLPPSPLPTPCARNIAVIRRERCYPRSPPPHLGFSITTATTHARCDRCALKLVSQLAYHDLDSIAHENESASPSVSPLFPFRFPPLSSVQRIKLKRRKDASTASNGRIFQFLEKLFNFHSLEEFRPNPCYTININMDRVIHGYIGYVVRLN